MMKVDCNALVTCINDVLRLRRLAWEEIRQRSDQREECDGSFVLQRAQRVCVLVSSSRGGTSVTAELLQWQGTDCVEPHGRMLTLPAEEKSHLILVGLAFPSRRERFDDLTAADAQSSNAAQLLDEMRSEVGYPIMYCDDLRLYATQLYRRLLLQWPLDLAAMKMETVIDRLTNALGTSFASGYYDNLENRRRVLAACARSLPFIRLPFYDCWPRHSAEEQDALTLVGRYWSLEETPFVLPPPWHNATVAEIVQGSLLLRDPSNAWRLPFWRTMFPKQRFEILHLVRDPRESVQGLCDGWNYPFGFQTMPIERPLTINGYTNRTGLGGNNWKRHRMNFSVSKALSQKLTGESESGSLVSICARQWKEAHESILMETDRLSLHRTVLDFGILRDWTDKAFRDASEALSLECSSSGLAYARSFQQRWVMATTAPHPAGRRRWKISPYSDEIKLLVESGYFDDVSGALGLGIISATPEEASSEAEAIEQKNPRHDSSPDRARAQNVLF